MNKSIITVGVIASTIALTAFIRYTKTGENKSQKAIDISNFDTSTPPGKDFYQYVNGSWLKNNPIPASESSWGSFHELYEKNNKNLRKILEEAAANKNAEKGSPLQKVGDFYAAGMDTVTIEKEGLNPLKSEFERITSIKTSDDLVKLIAHRHLMGMNDIFGSDVSADQKNSRENITYIGQGGISLPDCDYYTEADKELQEIREKYVAHVQKMFELMGDKNELAVAEAKVVMNIETALAKNSRNSEKARDIEKRYNKKTIQEVIDLTPSWNWNLYLKEVGILNIREMVVGEPEFLTGMETLLKSTSMDDWKTYLRWQLIHGTASKLNNAFVLENFRFYGTALSGAKELKPRWKRCLESMDGNVGELLGQLYVKKHFSEESKKRVYAMVQNLIAAYRERIETRDWMSPETKKQAQAKLQTVILKLGYPDKWRDVSQLEIKRDSYVLNFLRANVFESKRRIARLGQPVDLTEWGMTPQTVNAYYNPIINEIVFPAGIMQPPFFNPDADDAVNYGGMGSVIGHELTHGFDDQGSQFDAQGNLKNWWTEQDKENFKARSEKIVTQFNSYIAIDSLHVNGKLTLGENIADLGGLTISYMAYKRSLQGKPNPEKIDGFTADQRFFISWAQDWRGNYRPASLKQLVKTNPHAPGNFRVVGPLSNMKEFYEAFNLKPADAMYKPVSERAEVW